MCKISVMQRINLGKPYDEFIQSQIDSGYFGTATEVIRDSLRAKMAESENNRIVHIRALLEEGIESARNRPLIEVTKESLNKILTKARKMSQDKYKVPAYLKP